MLSVGKLAHGQERYYLDAVAAGVEDYYLGSGEAPGRWGGTGARLLGLTVGVDADDLRAVLAGVDPHSGDQLARAGTARRPRVPGFDLTFSAPKSVSVLYGVGAEPVVAEVVAGHEAAVAAGLDYLERHATFTRRRVDGIVETFKGEGLTIAAFRHRTSRAGDPQLHTHCLAANLVRAVDGRWGTLDSKSIYGHARTAGFVYQAVLRAELTDRLGVAWGEVHNGHAEITGLGRPILRAFSQRRVEIEGRLAERGQHSAAAAQAATLDTRHAKDYDVDPVTLRHGWAERAAALGVTADDLDALCRRAVARAGRCDEEAMRSELAGATGLTAHTASFERKDVVRAWCERLPPNATVSVDDLDRLSDTFLTSQEVVHLTRNTTVADGIRRSDGRLVPAEADRRRFSTLDMLAVERRVIHGAARRTHERVATVGETTVAAVLADRPELTDEQAAMVRHLTTSGAGVEVVVGKAGSGKTYALAAANAAWTTAGFHVTGVALAARAAQELEDSAGIPAATVAQLLMDLDQPDAPLGPRHVLIVDEAGMVDTRRLDQLFTHAQRAGAKVVLVGDHHQLPEVDAGGAFGGLVDRLGAVELVENRRQHHPWERHALDELRAGDVTAAMAAYQTRERIVAGDDADAVRDAMVTAWYKARRAGERVVMVTVRNRDVEDLNRRARERLLADGAITGDDLAVGERNFAVGDDVLCLRNDRRVGVINSTVGTVVRADHTTRSLLVELADGTRVTLPAEYLDAGDVTHAYATTVHKAQGLTVDRTYLLGSDQLYREAGYVGLSRGRATNHLYIVHHDHDEALELHPTSRDAPDPYEEVVNALRRSGAKHLATSEAEAAPVLPTDLARLWIQHDRLDHHLTVTAPPSPGPGMANVSPTAEQLRTRHAAAVAERDAAQTALIASRRGGDRRRAAQRAHSVGQHEAWLSEQLQTAESELATRESVRATRDAWEDEHQDELGALSDLRAGLRRVERAAGRAAELDPTSPVVGVLGPPPMGPQAREAWRTAAGALESYRARWGIDERPEPAEPTEISPVQQQHQAKLDDAVAVALRHLEPELLAPSAELATGAEL